MSFRKIATGGGTGIGTGNTAGSGTSHSGATGSGPGPSHAQPHGHHHGGRPVHPHQQHPHAHHPHHGHHHGHHHGVGGGGRGGVGIISVSSSSTLSTGSGGSSSGSATGVAPSSASMGAGTTTQMAQMNTYPTYLPKGYGGYSFGIPDVFPPFTGFRMESEKYGPERSGKGFAVSYPVTGVKELDSFYDNPTKKGIMLTHASTVSKDIEDFQLKRKKIQRQMSVTSAMKVCDCTAFLDLDVAAMFPPELLTEMAFAPVTQWRMTVSFLDGVNEEILRTWMLPLVMHIYRESQKAQATGGMAGTGHHLQPASQAQGGAGGLGKRAAVNGSPAPPSSFSSLPPIGSFSALVDDVIRRNVPPHQATSLLTMMIAFWAKCTGIDVRDALNSCDCGKLIVERLASFLRPSSGWTSNLSTNVVKPVSQLCNLLEQCLSVGLARAESILGDILPLSVCPLVAGTPSPGAAGACMFLLVLVERAFVDAAAFQCTNPMLSSFATSCGRFIFDGEQGQPKGMPAAMYFLQFCEALLEKKKTSDVPYMAALCERVDAIKAKILSHRYVRLSRRRFAACNVDPAKLAGYIYALLRDPSLFASAVPDATQVAANGLKSGPQQQLKALLASEPFLYCRAALNSDVHAFLSTLVDVVLSLSSLDGMPDSFLSLSSSAAAQLVAQVSKHLKPNSLYEPFRTLIVRRLRRDDSVDLLSSIFSAMCSAGVLSYQNLLSDVVMAGWSLDEDSTFRTNMGAFLLKISPEPAYDAASVFANSDMLSRLSCVVKEAKQMAFCLWRGADGFLSSRADSVAEIIRSIGKHAGVEVPADVVTKAKALAGGTMSFMSVPKLPSGRSVLAAPGAKSGSSDLTSLDNLDPFGRWCVSSVCLHLLKRGSDRLTLPAAHVLCANIYKTGHLSHLPLALAICAKSRMSQYPVDIGEINLRFSFASLLRTSAVAAFSGVDGLRFPLRSSEVVGVLALPGSQGNAFTVAEIFQKLQVYIANVVDQRSTASVATVGKVLTCIADLFFPQSRASVRSAHDGDDAPFYDFLRFCLSIKKDYIRDHLARVIYFIVDFRNFAESRPDTQALEPITECLSSYLDRVFSSPVFSFVCLSELAEWRIWLSDAKVRDFVAARASDAVVDCLGAIAAGSDRPSAPGLDATDAQVCQQLIEDVGCENLSTYLLFYRSLPWSQDSLAARILEWAPQAMPGGVLRAVIVQICALLSVGAFAKIARAALNSGGLLFTSELIASFMTVDDGIAMASGLRRGPQASMEQLKRDLLVQRSEIVVALSNDIMSKIRDSPSVTSEAIATIEKLLSCMHPALCLTTNNWPQYLRLVRQANFSPTDAAAVVAPDFLSCRARLLLLIQSLFTRLPPSNLGYATALSLLVLKHSVGYPTSQADRDIAALVVDHIPWSSCPPSIVVQLTTVLSLRHPFIPGFARFFPRLLVDHKCLSSGPCLVSLSGKESRDLLPCSHCRQTHGALPLGAICPPNSKPSVSLRPLNAPLSFYNKKPVEKLPGSAGLEAFFASKERQQTTAPGSPSTPSYAPSAGSQSQAGFPSPYGVRPASPSGPPPSKRSRPPSAQPSLVTTGART